MGTVLAWNWGSPFFSPSFFCLSLWTRSSVLWSLTPPRVALLPFFQYFRSFFNMLFPPVFSLQFFSAKTTVSFGALCDHGDEFFRAFHYGLYILPSKPLSRRPRAAWGPDPFLKTPFGSLRFFRCGGRPFVCTETPFFPPVAGFCCNFKPAFFLFFNAHFTWRKFFSFRFCGPLCHIKPPLARYAFLSSLSPNSSSHGPAFFFSPPPKYTATDHKFGSTMVLSIFFFFHSLFPLVRGSFSGISFLLCSVG